MMPIDGTSGRVRSFQLLVALPPPCADTRDLIECSQRSGATDVENLPPSCLAVFFDLTKGVIGAHSSNHRYDLTALLREVDRLRYAWRLYASWCELDCAPFKLRLIATSTPRVRRLRPIVRPDLAYYPVFSEIERASLDHALCTRLAGALPQTQLQRGDVVHSADFCSLVLPDIPVLHVRTHDHVFTVLTSWSTIPIWADSDLAHIEWTFNEVTRELVFVFDLDLRAHTQANKFWRSFRFFKIIEDSGVSFVACPAGFDCNLEHMAQRYQTRFAQPVVVEEMYHA